MKKEKKTITNVVKIGNRLKPELYEHAILIRMAPRIYLSNNKCIKLQVMGSLLEFADVIIKRFKSAGLDEISRKKKAIKVDSEKGSYILPDAWEITMQKIPILELRDEQEYEEE